MTATTVDEFRTAKDWTGLPFRLPKARRLRLPWIISPTPAAGSDALYVDAAYSALLESESTEEGTDEPAFSPTWLDDVYSFVSKGLADRAMDLLFRHVDDLLLASRYSQCEDLLRAIDLKRLDTNLLVGILAATLPAKVRLPERGHLVDRIEAKLQENAPGRVERLLDGLR